MDDDDNHATQRIWTSPFRRTPPLVNNYSTNNLTTSKQIISWAFLDNLFFVKQQHYQPILLFSHWKQRIPNFNHFDPLLKAFFQGRKLATTHCSAWTNDVIMLLWRHTKLLAPSDFQSWFQSMFPYDCKSEKFQLTRKWLPLLLDAFRVHVTLQN